MPSLPHEAATCAREYVSECECESDRMPGQSHDLPPAYGFETRLPTTAANTGAKTRLIVASG
jgi:hypothetical protein